MGAREVYQWQRWDCYLPTPESPWPYGGGFSLAQLLDHAQRFLLGQDGCVITLVSLFRFECFHEAVETLPLLIPHDEVFQPGEGKSVLVKGSAAE